MAVAVVVVAAAVSIRVGLCSSLVWPQTNVSAYLRDSCRPTGGGSGTYTDDGEAAVAAPATAALD